MLLVLMLFVPKLFAGETIVVGGLDGIDPESDNEPLEVKLALSGGGARGLASLGVLRAFEEREIEITAIAGTSIGGVIGGLYACGYRSEELTAIIQRFDFGSLFSNQPPRTSMLVTQRQGRERHLLSIRFDGYTPQIPQGWTSGQEMTSLLTFLTSKRNYLAGGDFNLFPIPFRAIVTDLVSGEEVVLDHGSLADAMRATMAFPLAFTGIEQGTRILMDGGMVTPVPVDVVRQLVDTKTIVIAVNTTSPLRDREELTTPLDIASQVTSIMTADKLADQLDRADFVIAPCPDNYSMMDFRDQDSIIEIGYHYGQKAADSIISLLQSRADTTAYSIDRLNVITDNRQLADNVSTRLLGRTLTRRQLLSELKRVTREHDLFDLTAEIEPDVNTTVGGNQAGNSVQLTVELHEPLQSSDVTFRLIGNSIYDNHILAGELVTGDSILDRYSLKEGLNRLIGLYKADGYDLANISEVAIDWKNYMITITIDEAIIRRIDVKHNRRTKDWLVRSYFPLEKGEPYSTRKASKGIANIYGTDLFERVTLDLMPWDSGGILTIGVKEKYYTQLRLGWHWHDEYESEEFLELLDDNIFGIGMEYLIHGQYGHDRQNHFTELRAHRIFSTYLTAQIRLYHNRIDRAIFDGGKTALGIREEKRYGGLIRVGQQIARLGTVSGGLTFEEVRSTDTRHGTEEKFGLRSINLQSLVETFNRMPFPQTGKKHLFELQITGKALGGDVEFTKFFSSLEAYFPFGRHLNYHPKLSIGISRTGLPPSEKFYAGGCHSFCGFRTNQQAGDKIILVNQELRLRLPLWFYLFALYDFGEVYTSSDQIKLRNLRHGWGLTLAVETLIGPFELGYGAVDSDTDRFYFNAGFEF